METNNLTPVDPIDENHFRFNLMDEKGLCITESDDVMTLINETRGISVRHEKKAGIVAKMWEICHEDPNQLIPNEKLASYFAQLPGVLEVTARGNDIARKIHETIALSIHASKPATIPGN